MQVSSKLGMICLNDSLLRRVLEGKVDAAEALAKAVDKDDLRVKLSVADASFAAAPAPAGWPA